MRKDDLQKLQKGYRIITENTNKEELLRTAKLVFRQDEVSFRIKREIVKLLAKGVDVEDIKKSLFSELDRFISTTKADHDSIERSAVETGERRFSPEKISGTGDDYLRM